MPDPADHRNGYPTPWQLLEKDILCALLTSHGMPLDNAARKSLVYEARLLAELLLENPAGPCPGCGCRPCACGEAPVDLAAASGIQPLDPEKYGVGDGNSAWDAVAGPAIESVNAALGKPRKKE